MEALRSIGARIDLEYAGIDFSIMEDKQILVFEANPTMLVHPERIGGPVEHKNVYVLPDSAQFRRDAEASLPMSGHAKAASRRVAESRVR